MSIPRDVQEFLDNYPGQKDDSGSTHNVEFYQNKRRCQPDRLLIDEIHEQSVHLTLTMLLLPSDPTHALLRLQMGWRLR